MFSYPFSPNPGFQNQLRLFYLMDCQLDYSHKAYRWHKIRTILFRGMHSHLWKAPFEEYIEKYTLDAVTPQRKSKSDPPSPVATDVNATADATATIDTTTTATTSATKQSASYLRFLKWSSSNNTNNTNTTEEQKPQDEEQQVQPAPRNPLAESISCRKCNKLLCTDANILNHPINIFQKKLPTEGFIDRETEIIIQHKDASDNCSVIFIEPMRWMRPQLLKSSNSQLMSFQSTENKGWFKLHCPDCFTKIGLFSFSSCKSSDGVTI